MSKVSRSDNVYHLRHTRCTRVAQRADLRCTASSFVISVFVYGDHTVEAYSNCGRTSVVYAVDLKALLWILMFLFKKNPSVWFAFLETESM